MNKLNLKHILLEVVLLVGSLFLAMKFNDWAIERRLNKRRDIALKNIHSEIERNLENLQTQGDNEDFHKITQAITPYLEIEEGDKKVLLEAQVEEMQTLRDSFPESLLVSDSTALSEGRFSYEVDIDVGGFNYAQLGDIAWEATKIGNLIDRIDFECIEGLLELYQLQESYLKYQEKYVEVLIDQDLAGIFNQFTVLHQFYEVLIEAYEEIMEGEMECMKEASKEQ